MVKRGIKNMNSRVLWLVETNYLGMCKFLKSQKLFISQQIMTEWWVEATQEGGRGLTHRGRLILSVPQGESKLQETGFTDIAHLVL